MTAYIVEADCEYSDEMHQVIERVVRCKNCKYYDHEDLFDDEMWWCTRGASDENVFEVEPDGFCAWGEMKDNDILACPFCGSEKVGCYESWTHWACQCDECGATMVKRGSREEAIEAWNTRHESIVRCDDCKHYNLGFCRKLIWRDNGVSVSICGDKFCAWGERNAD